MIFYFICSLLHFCCFMNCFMSHIYFIALYFVKNADFIVTTGNKLSINCIFCSCAIMVKTKFYDFYKTCAQGHTVLHNQGQYIFIVHASVLAIWKGESSTIITDWLNSTRNITAISLTGTKVNTIKEILNNPLTRSEQERNTKCIKSQTSSVNIS